MTFTDQQSSTPNAHATPAPETAMVTGVKGRQIWTARWPATSAPPRAAVLMVHGYGEHMGRYDHVISALTDAGYDVHGLDHHGHGRSTGRRAACRRFDDFVDDAETVLNRVIARDPGQPVFLFGHSMGGLIATRLALRRQADLAGLIASSAAYRVGDSISPLTKAIGSLIARILPDVPLLVTANNDILARDPAVGERVAADPLCYHGRTRAGLAYGILSAGQDTRARAAELTLPLLIMHGTADRVTSPAGSEEVYTRAHSADKTFRLWPQNFHELHNDLDQADVIATVVAWLNERTCPEA